MFTEMATASSSEVCAAAAAGKNTESAMNKTRRGVTRNRRIRYSSIRFLTKQVRGHPYITPQASARHAFVRVFRTQDLEQRNRIGKWLNALTRAIRQIGDGFAFLAHRGR